MSELQQRRAKIRELDEQILRLIAARTEQAKAIGAIKKSQAIPLRDWEVEKQVLERSAEVASELGLPAELTRTVMQALISTSRAAQERTSYSAYQGSAEEILIIGGLGKMGRWFADFFRNQGHRIEIYDTQPGTQQAAVVSRLEEGLERASFALIATPLEVVPQSIARLAELVRASGLHLHEHERALLLGDDVHLARARAEVALADAVAARAQIARGMLLADTCQLLLGLARSPSPPQHAR